MKKIIVLTPILSLAFASQVFAASSSEVRVENNVSSNSNSTTTTTTQTNIRIETDGKVTEYSSNEPGKIEVKSENGSSEIKVNGNIVSEDTSATPSPTATNSPTPKPEEDQEENESLIETVKEKFSFLEKIFSLFD